MKILTTLLIITSLFFSTGLFSQKGVIVEGVINDANGEFVSMAYAPRFRGNLNFDGFRSVGSYVDEKGHFKLKTDQVTHTASYSLEFPKQGIGINLFDGDSIYFEVDQTDLDQVFATGKGAGKINVLRLDQFQWDVIDLRKETKLEKFVEYANSITNDRLDLIKAIYSKDVNSALITKAENSDELLKIIERSPLNGEEYEFLSMIEKFNFYNIFNSFISQKTQENFDTTPIDLNSAAFRHFNGKVYRELEQINNFTFAGSLEVILQVEYLRSRQVNDKVVVNYHNWMSFFRGQRYVDWIPSFLEQYFNEDIYYKHQASLPAWYLSMGQPYKEYLKTIDQNIENKYTNRIKEFEYLLKHALNNEEYGLYKDSRTLDKIKLQELLGAYTEISLYTVFWSAQFAGSSIINKIPSFKEFEKEHKGDVKMIYICIDKEKYKNLWAARIVDESWKGDHYFIPLEGNENIFSDYSNSKIDSFCNGGATYGFIDKKGKLNNQFEAPYNLRKNEIEDFIDRDSH